MCFLMAKQLNMLTPNKEVVTLKFMGDPHHFINVQKVEFRLAFGKLLHNYWKHCPVEIVDLPIKHGDVQ